MFGTMSESEFETRKFTKEDFEKPETEIEKWILGDVIQALNLMREQYAVHMGEGDVEEAGKYMRGISRMLDLTAFSRSCRQ